MICHHHVINVATRSLDLNLSKTVVVVKEVIVLKTVNINAQQQK